MVFLNESHIEDADIQLFELILGYQDKIAAKNDLIARENLKEVVFKKR